MALIDKETIRKEIERQRQFIEELFTKGDNSFYDGQDDAYCYILALLAFLDSIQEQPVIKKSNALFDKCVENCDPAVMKEVSDNIDKMLGRQPVEGLDKKLAEYFRESSEDFQTRAKDLLFSYECKDKDTKLLLEEAVHFVEDVQDFFHHIVIV